MVKSQRFSFNEPHMIGIILSRNQTTNVSHFYGDSRNDNNHRGAQCEHRWLQIFETVASFWNILEPDDFVLSFTLCFLISNYVFSFEE